MATMTKADEASTGKQKDVEMGIVSGSQEELIEATTASMTKADEASTGKQKDVEMGIVNGSQASTPKQGIDDLEMVTGSPVSSKQGSPIWKNKEAPYKEVEEGRTWSTSPDWSRQSSPALPLVEGWRSLASTNQGASHTGAEERWRGGGLLNLTRMASPDSSGQSSPLPDWMQEGESKRAFLTRMAPSLDSSRQSSPVPALEEEGRSNGAFPHPSSTPPSPLSSLDRAPSPLSSLDRAPSVGRNMGFDSVEMDMGFDSAEMDMGFDSVEMEIDSGSQGHGHRISVDKEKGIWVKFIEARLEENTLSRIAGTATSCIHIVPEGFRTVIYEAYEPCLISIGPYHRGNARLESMEERKWECLRDILNPSQKTQLSQQNLDRREEFLSNCFHKLRPLENKARSFYSDNNLQSMDFMEMMLLDGCFIVDYFRRPSHYIPSTRTWVKREINNDLLLFENQLPLFVLIHIYALVKKEDEKKEFLDHALEFCMLVGGKKTMLSVSMLRERELFDHLLHLYHTYLFYGDRKRANQPIVSEIRTIHTASFLKNAGIKFKEKKVIDKVIDVTFEDGDMNITPLVIDAFTISQYRNLIAFEKFHPSIEPQFTAFAQFMVYIINTSKDVILLREKGIIEHALGSDQEVVNVFNQLTTGTFEYLTSGLVEVYTKAGKYCKKKQNKWLAKLKRDHLSNPWKVTSLAVGTLILLFGILQAFFTVFNYIKR